MNKVNYQSAMEKSGNVDVGGITILKREDGNFAMPGGGYVTNLGYAEKIAKRLSNNHPKVKTPLGKLVDKTVKRMEFKAGRV